MTRATVIAELRDYIRNLQRSFGVGGSRGIVRDPAAIHTIRAIREAIRIIQRAKGVK